MKFKITKNIFHHHVFQVEVEAESREEAEEVFNHNDTEGEYVREWEDAEDYPVYHQEITSITEVKA